MILNVYSIFDTKALVFNTPFFAHNNASAVRSVSDLAADLNTSVGRHPSDFVLYRIGQYNDEQGVLAPLDIREHVVDVISLVAPKAPDLFNTGAK